MKHARNFVRLILIMVGLTAVGLGVYTWQHRSPGAPPYVGGEAWSSIPVDLPLRNDSEHDAALTRNGGEPYVLEIPAGPSGAILYYGASHTRAADHPQIRDIEARWDSFRPTAALCEGRSRGYFFGALIEPFAGLPEPALVHKLARRDEVPLFSLEPQYRDEVAALLEEFSPEQVALYFFLRVYMSEAQGFAKDGLAADLLAKRTDVEGLRGSLASLAAVDSLWLQDFHDREDWRILTAEPQGSYLSDISAESRRIRGEHMIRTVTDLARRGERVFAVVGSGHVIRQEWNLRALFDLEPAWDQPRSGAEAID